MGLLKSEGGGERGEGRGNGVVMNVVPQLPSFRVFIFHFYRGGGEERARGKKGRKGGTD